MSVAPSLGIPELAGLCSYDDAARVGHSVEENVRRLLRYHWVELRLRAITLSHLPATPEWEVKCAFALHQLYDTEHVNLLRTRIIEMRNPVPRFDTAPDTALEAFLDELSRSTDTIELLTGIYRVARPALADAYRRHLKATNPLVDHPTQRIIRQIIGEEDDALVWGGRAVSALLAGNPAARKRSAAWEEHLSAYLAAARGIAGDGDATAVPERLPMRRATGPFVPDMHPRRDRRFKGELNFNFPPHQIKNTPGISAAERNLALLCKRTLEMDVPEMMASILVERRDRPWEYHLEMSRQLWDEARHAMMGTVWFEAKRVDWTKIPLNIGFSLRLNLHADPIERQLMLFAIEQSLMPADSGKRFEYETAVEAGDALSAHFHDYDWADEVLHVHIGRRWVKDEGITPQEAIERGQMIHERTWAELEQYKVGEEQAEWWPDFVHQVLGVESAARPETLAPLKEIDARHSSG